MITPITDTSVDLQLDGHWVMEFVVRDDDYAFADSPTITVTSTSPSSDVTTPTAQMVATGLYRATVEVDEGGRWKAAVVAPGYGSVTFTAYVSEGDTFPTLADVKSYLAHGGDEDEEISFPDEVIQDALDAEAQAQRDKCSVPGVYPATLSQALKRRVARNLAMRGLPIAVFQGDEESGSLTLPSSDPEVRRLEGAYRKLVQPCL